MPSRSTTRIITASSAFPRANDAAHATKRMSTSGFKNRAASSMRATPCLSGAGLLGPYRESRSDASADVRPDPTADFGGTSAEPEFTDALALDWPLQWLLISP